MTPEISPLPSLLLSVKPEYAALGELGAEDVGSPGCFPTFVDALKRSKCGCGESRRCGETEARKPVDEGFGEDRGDATPELPSKGVVEELLGTV